MPLKQTEESSNRMVLWARTAAELMMPNPVSIPAEATIPEAVAALTDRGFSAAPVIDEAGRPVGVLSRADILLHSRLLADGKASIPGKEEITPKGSSETGQQKSLTGLKVQDIMTPAVFSVPPDAPAARVVQDMLVLKVHRLFVVDHDGTLIGVISALDVLRNLRF